MKPKSILTVTLACLAVLVFAQSVALGAPRSFQTLAQRLPASSNAIVVINAAKVLDSPYGKREHWAKNVAEAWATQPVMIPPGASRLIMAADVKTSNMESNWEMSLMDMDKMPTLQELVDAEGGHIDRLWDKDSCYSPINAYLVPIEPTVLASITPADRSTVARWVRTPVKPEGNVESAYIRSVIAGLSEKTDIVMAMDLEDAWGLPNIRRFLDDNDIKEIPAQNMGVTAQVLETMKGIMLEISVGEKVTGKATVKFEKDAGLLKDCAKPVMIAVLKRCGMRTDDVQNWTFTTAGPQVSMQGDLSAAGLRELLGFVQSPIPAATVAADAPKSNPGQPEANPAAASQRYFKAVDLCVKNLQQGASMSATAAAIRNASKRIEQLPILHVDPALVEWGSQVSVKLKQASGVLQVGQLQINSRVAGVKDPDYTQYSYGEGGNASANNAMANTNRERRALAAQQQSESLEKALNIVNEIAGTTPRIRAEMVAKYNVEF